MNQTFSKITFVTLLSVLLVACGTSQKLSLSDTLQTEMEAGNYQLVYDQVVPKIKELEEKDKQPSNEMLQMAGESAYELGKVAESRKYLEKVVQQNPSNEEVYPTLAKLYKQIDNLSFEISNYQDYFKYFPEGKYTPEMQKGLFDAYVRSENYEAGAELWKNLSDSVKQDEAVLENYLITNQRLKNPEKINETVKIILKTNPKNRPALKAKAYSLYNAAELRYKREMAAYNKNKTRKQYNILLAELDKSTAQFKKSRDLYEPLYKEQAEKDIARYLSNIYARLNNKSKASYYKKLSK